MDIFRKFNRKSIDDRQIDTLIGLSKGLLADGKVDQSVATFLMSERLPATVENITAFFRREKREPPPGFSPDEAQGLVALLIIDSDLLKDLTERVRKAIEAYRKCLKKASRPQENDACDRRAERDVCDTLNRIKNRNKGKLPTDMLKNQWDSFGCVEV